MRLLDELIILRKCVFGHVALTCRLEPASNVWPATMGVKTPIVAGHTFPEKYSPSTSPIRFYNKGG